MKTVEIMLTPDFANTAREMGYEEGDDYDSDAVLFQQGFDIEILEVKAGEKFTIGGDWEKGQIDCDGETFKMKKKVSYDDYVEIVEYDDSIHFGKGKYIFHDDGITFELLENHEYF